MNATAVPATAIPAVLPVLSPGCGLGVAVLAVVLIGDSDTIVLLSEGVFGRELVSIDGIVVVSMVLEGAILDVSDEAAVAPERLFVVAVRASSEACLILQRTKSSVALYPMQSQRSVL